MAEERRLYFDHPQSAAFRCPSRFDQAHVRGPCAGAFGSLDDMLAAPDDLVPIATESV